MGGYRRLSIALLAHTHQQMGTIERRHRQIVETGLSLLSHSHLLQHFWEDAFTTAMYIISRSKPCIFLGYIRNHNGYKCLVTSTGKVYVSHHVVFDEHRFPFQQTSTSSPPFYNTLTASLPLQPISHPPQHDPDTNIVSSDNSLSFMSQDFADAGLEADSPNLDSIRR